MLKKKILKLFLTVVNSVEFQQDKAKGHKYKSKVVSLEKLTNEIGIKRIIIV